MDEQNKMRILLVDDNQSIHEDFKYLLSDLSGNKDKELEGLEEELFKEEKNELLNKMPEYVIDDAFQGQEAVEMAEAALEEGFPYSIIFMDVRMPPGLDGIQASKLIWEKSPHVEIVICTAYADYTWEEILKAFGPTDHLLFIKKPFNSVMIKQVTLTLSTKWDLDKQNRNLIAHLEETVDERTTDIKKLLAEKEKHLKILHQDMALAVSAQSHLLPKDIPQMKDLDMNVFYAPCQKIGGDLYDIIPTGPNELFVIVQDVSGHGIAAALVTSIVKFSFRKYIMETQDLGQVMTLLNQDLCKFTHYEMFVSAVAVKINLEKRKITTCSAGHPPLIQVHQDPFKVDVIRGDNMFLGIENDIKYRCAELKMKKDSTLLMYTDGLTEAQSPKRELYGKERIIEILESHQDLKGKALIDFIKKEIKTFTANRIQSDDIALICLDF